MNHNFRSRYINGNVKKNGIKILHWNPGSKHLHNKLVNIESVVNTYKPGILGISESNFFEAHDINDVRIENYKLLCSGGRRLYIQQQQQRKAQKGLNNQLSSRGGLKQQKIITG